MEIKGLSREILDQNPEMTLRELSRLNPAVFKVNSDLSVFDNFSKTSLAISRAFDAGYYVRDNKLYNNGRVIKDKPNLRVTDGYPYFKFTYPEHGTRHDILLYRLIGFEKYGWTALYNKGIKPLKMKDGDKTNLSLHNVVLTDEGEFLFKNDVFEDKHGCSFLLRDIGEIIP